MKVHERFAVLGPAAIRDALVLTDSAQDLALLEACRRPLRAVWPEARFREGLSGVYLPGLYLTRIKRPGERYVIRAILQEDFAFWVLATVGLAAVPVAHVLGLLFLLGSFWAIYERGYVDNDQIAARFEARPKLSAAFAGSDVVTPRWQPWCGRSCWPPSRWCYYAGRQRRAGPMACAGCSPCC